MELTQQMIDYCERQKWNEDVRQAVYVKVLEHPPVDDIHNGWLGVIYRNCLKNSKMKDARRRELEREAVADLEGLHGMDDIADPLEYLEAEALVENAGCLSPLLYNTLRDYVLGKAPEDIAQDQGVSANTVYQRLWRAKKEIMYG